ncbi:MAG: type II toxin-antitoxin system PemK/MazF family toxin, partial [Sphingobacteriaceae bacterium]|nr:type II toxin-antitoxin system PemK/MazF family toxin [Cytophagaceae bacterium]
EYQKMRPALVVENDDYLSLGNLVTVVPVSSQTDKATLLNVPVRRNEKNRLQKDSLIKTRQISTFDKRRFVKRIGTCQESVLDRVLANISLYLQR